MKKLFKIFILLVLLIGCSDSINENIDFVPLKVDVRMEVQILDSVYQIYSRPLTKIYFTTYKYSSDNTKTYFSQSDTTSCPNGWGVKLLHYTLNNPNEYIVLGASNEKYDGNNYREIIIDYDEAELRSDSTNYSSIIKTFAIYYQ